MRERPRSPDVQIYRPQLTSVLSIAHRMSGAWLAFGSLFLVVWLTSVAAGGSMQAGLRGFFDSWPGGFLLFCWILALYFHLCNGIRHLAWDLNYGFELVTIYRSGWLVVIASLFLTLLTWVIARVLIG